MLQKGIWWTLLAVPVFYTGYSLATGGDDNTFGRMFQQFKEGKRATEEADALHTAVMAQAITDRARLSSYPREVSGPNLKNPEYVVKRLLQKNRWMLILQQGSVQWRITIQPGSRSNRRSERSTGVLQQGKRRGRAGKNSESERGKEIGL